MGRTVTVEGRLRQRLFAETAPHATLPLRDTTATGAGVLINHYVLEGPR